MIYRALKRSQNIQRNRRGERPGGSLRKRNIRLTRIAIVIVCIFITCHLPRFIPNIMEMFMPVLPWVSITLLPASCVSLGTCFHGRWNMNDLHFPASGVVNNRERNVINFRHDWVVSYIRRSPARMVRKCSQAESALTCTNYQAFFAHFSSPLSSYNTWIFWTLPIFIFSSGSASS